MIESAPSLRSYVRDIERTYRLGNATEHSYRSHLKQLIEALTPGIVATNEPRRIACGAPDLIITRGQTPLGYIETKDVGISLEQVERSEQMKRYLGSLANLILTDYVEFRWYVAGQPRMSASRAKVNKKGAWQLEADGMEQVSKLLSGFLITATPTVTSPKELATRMAAIAQLIRNAITQAFKSEEGGGSLHAQLKGFQRVLLPELDAEQFADMYAQTICYGLFAARCNVRAGVTFTREHAAFDIPRTNPFLRKMFSEIAGPDLDERIVWAVDDLAEVLNRADMTAILHDFGRRTRQEDPIVHFYETFLAAYDPRMREARGVYYTPEPVVSYIVRSVDALLKSDFNLPDGLADATKIRLPIAAHTQNNDGTDPQPQLQETHKVQILDPATGTGTFLHSVIDLIHDTFKGNQGMWSGYVSQHLLPRLFGFELLMAPYAVAHMKLGLQLAETGYDFSSSERLGVYLTNTLEEGFEGSQLPFAAWIVEEATAAGNVKYDAPVMVVIGNPPYSGHSANKGTWITHLLHGKDDKTGKQTGNYFEVDGKPLGERNPKWLNDDYVKFIRFAQWRIEQTGYGILAFISNHGYLDNPTFRGMRQSLIQSFDEIYALDLHGNSKKKERSPDGTKDENVFDIQQGVAIGIFVKRQSKTSAQGLAKVHHADLWGSREVFENVGDERRLVSGKYRWLAEHDITTTVWTGLAPELPFYLFVPQNIDMRAEYEQGWQVTEIFPTNNIGMQTHRDYFITDINKSELRIRINALLNTELTDIDLLEKFDLRNLDLTKIRAKLRADKHREERFVHCLWRPFDTRYLYYESALIDRPRPQITEPLLKANVALLSMRQIALQNGCSHFLATNAPPIDRVFYSDKGAASVFPLYLYPDPNKKNTLFDTDAPTTAPGGRRPNLSAVFIADCSKRLNMRFVEDGKGDLRETFGPEDVFHYMYAVFHAPAYRTRYAEFLKIDFPRLPLTSNVDLFRELCALGERLTALHVMEQFGAALPTYPIEGNNMVEKIEYRVPEGEPLESGPGCVYINKTQYFDGMPPQVWEFHVGGYQVCHKWLKDRKGRVLSYEDIRHYQRVVAALGETIALMERIDEAIEEHGGWPIF
jgi:predicted helicase